jgi:hypothetical protein
MTQPDLFDIHAPETAFAPRKRWMGYALALSLMLHLLAVAFIVAGGSAVHTIPAVSRILVDSVTFAPIISPAKPAEPVAIPAPSEAATLSEAPPNEKPPLALPAAQASPPEKASERMKELMATPLGLGMTYGYISSLAEGRSLREDIRGYYFELVEKINREWWKRANGLKEPIRRDGIIELFLRPDGSVISQRIYQGTGSREADQVIQDVVRAVAPLPPLPASFDQKVFQAPLKIKAPSTLFRITE